jgi:hypothetical protein
MKTSKHATAHFSCNAGKGAKEAALKQFYDDMEAAWNEYQQDTTTYPQAEIPEEQR